MQAGAPTEQHLLHGLDVDTEQIGEWREIGRKRHDRADIQIPVRPAVEALADAGANESSTVEWQNAH